MHQSTYREVPVDGRRCVACGVGADRVETAQSLDGRWRCGPCSRTSAPVPPSALDGQPPGPVATGLTLVARILAAVILVLAVLAFLGVACVGLYFHPWGHSFP
jgi:hypothetical protein